MLLYPSWLKVKTNQPGLDFAIALLLSFSMLTKQFLIQLVSFATSIVCGMAVCQDEWCAYRCMADWDNSLDFCEPNCEKGQGKCKAGTVSVIVDPYAYPGCLTPGSKDKGSSKEDVKNDKAKKDDGKSGSVTVCSLSSTSVAGPGTTSYSTTYNITKASNGTFAEGDGGIVGFIPDGSGPFPLFMWMPGTHICAVDPMPQYQVQQMANRGFVAVAVQWPDKDSYVKFEQKADAVAGSNPDTALSKMCAHEKVDCSAGVAIGGYSQGTHIAALAAKISDKIKAAYMIAGGRPTAEPYDLCDDSNIGDSISKTKRRYITGEADQYFAWLSDSSRGVCRSSANASSNLKLASGYDCGSKTNCLQSDGSGYYVATVADTCGEKPDHFNWMLTTSKSEPAKEVTAWFKPMNDASLDWLVQAAKSDQASAHTWTAASCPEKPNSKPDGKPAVKPDTKPDAGVEKPAGTAPGQKSDTAATPTKTETKFTIKVKLEEAAKFDEKKYKEQLAQGSGVESNEVEITSKEYVVKVGYKFSAEAAITAAAAQTAIAADWKIDPSLVNVMIDKSRRLGEGRRLEKIETKVTATLKTSDAATADRVKNAAKITTGVATALSAQVSVTTEPTLDALVIAKVVSSKTITTPDATQLQKIATAAGGSGATLEVPASGGSGTSSSTSPRAGASSSSRPPYLNGLLGIVLLASICPW